MIIFCPLLRDFISSQAADKSPDEEIPVQQVPVLIALHTCNSYAYNILGLRKPKKNSD